MNFSRGFSANWFSSCLFLGLTLLAAGCSSSTPADALQAIYRVEVGQCLAVENQLATAVAVGPELLVTVAHSLEQADGVTIKDGQGVEVASELVYVDQAKDIAFFALTDPQQANGLGSALELAEPAESGAVSIATGSRDEGPNSKQATILDLLDATLDGEGKRAAIKLEADIKPGDSGAAVVNADGRMVGMIFATARGQNIGWAVASSELRDALAQLESNGPETITLSC